MANNSAKTGVVLMTYGSATTAEHTERYFKNIYGENVSEALIADFKERYRLVGHSPLIEITREQAALLEAKLGDYFAVRAGMRHSEPTIAHAVGELKEAGAKRIVGIILSPQFSPYIMEGYRTKLADAARTHDYAPEECTVAAEWSTEPHFIELLAKHTSEALAALRERHGTDVPVVFTTHSLPKRVVEKDPGYLAQIAATTDAIVAKMDDASLQWRTGYQSAGHTPEEWLTPDLTDILAELSAAGHRAVLIVPVQFLADHLEVLYDLDIAAKAQCAEYGIEYDRIELPNTDPLFTEALGALVHEHTS